ncbi:MFS transporter [uncultured Alistipes sp.]|nr:MFS transporter [uncultured Alistipes sp.]
MTRNTRTLRLLVPTMLTFFTMGFVDSVGIATNYIKDDFALSDTLANLCPSMVFFWFLVCSVPTGMLMNRIGRARTVRLSVAVTALALLAPVIDYSFATMMVSFSLLGIGNALMQVSLNPLVSSVVTGDRLASTLTFGQFVKAIASFVAPLIAAWGVLHGASWRILFPVFAAIAVIALVYMSLTRFPEASENRRSSTFGACFALLRKPFILLAFLGILCHVGIDVGTNVTAPKLLIERLGMELTDAGYATSLYFLFRTLGCLSGSLILTRIPAMRFFLFSVGLMLLAAAGLFCLDGKGAIYVCVALLGFGNSNIFPIIFSRAMLRLPDKQNEVSGLMIMGLIGGTVFPLLMGALSDALGSQNGSVAVIGCGALYLLWLSRKLQTDTK